MARFDPYGSSPLGVSPLRTRGSRRSRRGPLGPVGPQGPRGEVGPLGPLGPQGPGPTAAPAPRPGATPTRGVQAPQRGPNAMQLQAAYDAFHPQDTTPDYEALFNQSLERQRASIDASLRQVLGDIEKRRAAGAQIVSMQPGEVNALYDRGQSEVNRFAGAASQSLAQAGAATPGAAQQAGVDAIRAAMEQARTFALQDQPYLSIGAADLYNRQAGAAQLAAQQGQADIEAQRAGFYGDLAGTQLRSRMELQMQQQAQDDELERRFALEQMQQRQEALQARGATRAGSPRWWQANALVDPEGAARMQSNFQVTEDNLKLWQENPDIWEQTKRMLDPGLVSFLRFQYGLR